MKVKLLYIAGPYRAPSAWLVEQNIREAEAWAFKVAELGAMPICPHTNTRGYFESIGTAEFWLGGTMELMRRCDGVFLLPRWCESSGARTERVEALAQGLPVFSHMALGALKEWIDVG